MHSCSLPKSPGESYIFHIYLGCTKSYLACQKGSNSVMPVGVFVNLSVTALESYHGIEQRFTHLYPIALRLITLGPIRSYRCYISPHTHTHNQQPLSVCSRQLEIIRLYIPYQTLNASLSQDCLMDCLRSGRGRQLDAQVLIRPKPGGY